MRILLTGGAGYVGSVTAHQLLDAGHEVTILDSLLHGGRALLSLYPRDGVTFVRGDLRDRAVAERAVAGAEIVVHLAAIVGDPACQREPELARSTNLEGSLQLLELSERAGVERFVFASTCSNYGRMSSGLEYVDETAELSPLSLYAETKVAVERELLGRGPEAAPVATVLRFATVHGLSPRPRFDLTVNEFAAELYLNRHLVVFGEQFWRPYIHVRDAARAVALVVDAPGAAVAGRVFNVGSTAENYRKADLVELVLAEVGDDVEVERVHREEDPRDYRVAFERVREELGFEPTRTVRDGIREVIDALAQGVLLSLDDAALRN